MLELWGCRACLVVCKDITVLQGWWSYESITDTLNLSVNYTTNVILHMRHASAGPLTNHVDASIRTPRTAKQQDSCRVRMLRV